MVLDNLPGGGGAGRGSKDNVECVLSTLKYTEAILPLQEGEVGVVLDLIKITQLVTGGEGTESVAFQLG